ncbi:MAG: hypothetical protein HY231_21205 [Acidobacteria bacterium]|nr:hypothetical protein [Acidobacteriota bacterium]
MKSTMFPKIFSRLLLLTAGLAITAAMSFAQGQGEGLSKANSKKEEKATTKEANKLAAKADEAEQGLGRDAVFCVLAAHTTGIGTAQQLKDKYNALQNFPFGQFVAAVVMADRIDKPLDEILTKLQAGASIGQIAKDYDVNLGELRKGFGEFRSELARSMTNPPTRNCFSTP